MRKIVKVFVDGASKGNPGDAGAGILIEVEGKPITILCHYIGNITNNVAEYMALILGIKEVIFRDLCCPNYKISFYSDSELVVKQINGEYHISSGVLQKYYNQAIQLLSLIPQWSIEHISRSNNKKSDQLATVAVKLWRKFHDTK